jgi:predicted transcriptional regulator
LTGLPLGQVLYHLDRLERMGLVVSTRDYGFRRYFVARNIDRREKKFLGALRHEVPRHIVIELLDRPGQTHKEMQALLGIAGSTLSFHLSRLAESGVVVREREGNATVYHLSDPALLKHELVDYRESFDDPLVDAFVQRSLREPSRATVAEPAIAS